MIGHFPPEITLLILNEWDRLHTYAQYGGQGAGRCKKEQLADQQRKAIFETRGGKWWHF